ncbi:hypothetical protein ACFSO7_02765 [Bacillus sp. CGMCC 1.16607]
MKVQLTKEQTAKFLSCFIEDARRLVIARKQKAKETESAIKENEKAG